MDCIEAHWNRRSATYDDFVVKGYSDMRERRSWQAHFSSILGTEPLDVLDVGCGHGIVSMQLADLGHRVTSVDISEDMLGCARRNAAANGLSIDFRRGDAMSLDMPDGSFDAVVSDYMLWTVPDPRAVVSEWHRVLRDGGTLAYTDGDWFHDPRMTPLRSLVSGMFLRIDGTGAGDEDPEFRAEDLWSSSADRPRDDVRMLGDAGFRDIRVMTDVQRRVLHGVRYLAHGLTNSHFTVVARKRSLRRAYEEREREVQGVAVPLQPAGVAAVRLDEDLLDPQLDEVLQVPLGPPLPAQGQVQRDVPHDPGVHAAYQGVVRPPVPAGIPELLVVEVQVMVPVEHHEPAAVPQDPEPFAVRAQGVLQVPHHVP